MAQHGLKVWREEHALEPLKLAQIEAAPAQCSAVRSNEARWFDRHLVCCVTYGAHTGGQWHTQNMPTAGMGQTWQSGT